MSTQYCQETETSSGWMMVFISLLLVLLALFVFLTTFTEPGSSVKVRVFRESFRKSLLISSNNSKQIQALFQEIMPWQKEISRVVKKIKATGLNQPLMDEFLTVADIEGLTINQGKNGVSLIFPEAIRFYDQSLELRQPSRLLLAKIAYLAADVPYLVEIRGYANPQYPKGFSSALEFSARRAAVVYQLFIEKQVNPWKLKVSGFGDAFYSEKESQDKVEIIFKELEL
jgi:flagellar motor protein MotB